MSLSRGGSRTGSTDNGKAEEIRDYLVRAAEVCFERYGVSKTTMEDVAAMANVSRPTIYRYFKTREGLLLAVLLRALRNFNAEAEELIAGQATFADAVVEAMTLCVHVGVTDPHVRLLLGPESYGLSSMLVGGSPDFYTVAAEVWEPLLRQAVRSGEARADLDVTAACRWLLDVAFLLVTRVLEGALPERKVPQVLREFVVPGLVSPPTGAKTGRRTAKSPGPPYSPARR
jgi:AcrR family transcriptional regulator